MDDIAKFHREQQDWKVHSITEWHQETKKRVSGTAVAIADSLGYDHALIIIQRNDRLTCSTFAIPNTSDSYAVHQIVFASQHHNVERLFSLKTVGRDSYATGALAIAIKLADGKTST
jgi:dihydrodipicolinate reductase